jgi:phage gp29-like protein
MKKRKRTQHIAATKAEPSKSGLRVMQTAGQRSLTSEYASHPSRGLTPAKLASVMTAAEQGDLIAINDLATDMEEKDAHLYSELHKRRMAVAQLPWSIEPARNPTPQEKDKAKRIEETIRDLPFDLEDVVFDLTDGVLHGFSCLEFSGWTRRANGIMQPNGAIHRPQSWFTLDQATRQNLLLRANTEAEGELWPYGWMIHVHRSRSGYLARAGLARVLVWPYLYKNYAIRDLAEFLEIYGLPVRIGKFPQGTPEDKQSEFLAQLHAIGHSATGVMVDTMQVEFMAAASGQADPFQAMMAWADRAESKAILGGTLTSEPGDVGSRSLGTVHDEIRNEIRDSDARQIASTITRYLVWPILQLNGLAEQDETRQPRFVFDTGEPEDMALYADALPKLVSIGVKVPERWARDKLRIPEAEGQEDMLSSEKPHSADQPMDTMEQQESPQTEQVKRKAATSTGQRFTPQQQAIEDLADSALDAGSQPISAESIRNAIAAARSPEDLENRLAALLAGVDRSEFQRQLERALFAADVIGYAA